jgi:hypothetical protein
MNVSSARGAWQKYARSVRRADDGGGGRVVVVAWGFALIVLAFVVALAALTLPEGR